MPTPRQDYLPLTERFEITRRRLKNLLAGAGRYGVGNRNLAIRSAVETLESLGEDHGRIMEMFR